MKRRELLIGAAGIAAALVAGCAPQKGSRWTGTVEHGSGSIPNGWTRSVTIYADSVEIHADKGGNRSRPLDDALRRRIDDLINQAVAAPKAVAPKRPPGSSPYSFDVRSSSGSTLRRSATSYDESAIYNLAEQIYEACTA